MSSLIHIFIIFSLLILNPIKTNSAEILQINSPKNILVGDQNRNLPISLFCLETDEQKEQEATNLLKKEFPRGSKVKIKPMGFKDNMLVARVFNISETKEMSELLYSRDLSEKGC